MCTYTRVTFESLSFSCIRTYVLYTLFFKDDYKSLLLFDKVKETYERETFKRPMKETHSRDLPLFFVVWTPLSTPLSNKPHTARQTANRIATRTGTHAAPHTATHCNTLRVPCQHTMITHFDVFHKCCRPHTYVFALLCATLCMSYVCRMSTLCYFVYVEDMRDLTFGIMSS